MSTWMVSNFGITLGVWALVTMSKHINTSPRLRKNAPLQTNGHYRFIRHPMYTALLLFCGAYLLGAHSFYPVWLWLSLLFVLACKIYYEEKMLREQFPNYKTYAQKTRRLIPFIS